jgi:hypothetical protein
MARPRSAPVGSRVTALQLACLRDEWRPGEPTPEGLDAAEEFWWGRGELLTIRAAWDAVGLDITAEWSVERPGTRPSCWWQYEAPGPRRRLGGIGTSMSNCSAYAPEFRRGIPTHWLTREMWDFYATFSPGGAIAEAEPLDPADPPTYESESAYLARLNLLLPGEFAPEQPDELVCLGTHGAS